MDSRELNMSHRTLGPVLLLIVLTLVSTGCIVIAGGSKRESVPPTVGQQLVDLKAARDCGAISQEEFEQSKIKLLKELKHED